MKILKVSLLQSCASRRFSTSLNLKHRTVEGGIKLRNSIISSAEHPAPTAILNDETVISWYSCGPTVYDAAHIGHARTYVCTDIIRRILTDIHHKEVNFAVGVTDIDDKIIDRAVLNGLTSWAQTELMVRALESDFFTDLDALNVRRPDAVLRVTEHIQEIIDYILKILDSGRAYVTPDGVYFSVPSCGDSYLQFQDLSVPPEVLETPVEAENASEAQSIDANKHKLPPLGHKRDRRDFALWKSVKPGEPSWESPWGCGRPGWHIECSAITHTYFGPSMSIHSGGIDLQFPHHTNEIAQCAAHNCEAPSKWVKFWVHTGHLYIEGRKMSKSLKNFISIKEFLEGGYSTNPATDFRIFCLMNKYHSAIHFSKTRIDEAGTFRRKIENYLKLSESVISSVRLETKSNIGLDEEDAVIAARSSKPTVESRALRSALSACQLAVRDALAEDFDTPEALKAMSYLVGDAIKYASAVAVSAPAPVDVNAAQGGVYPVSQPIEPLLAVSCYLTDILFKLGVDLLVTQSKRQTPSSFPSSSMASTRAHSPEEVAILESLIGFRSKVRSSSLTCMKAIKAELKSSKDAAANPIAEIAKSAVGDVLKACDLMRISAGTQLGVQIEDVSESLSIWRPLEIAKNEGKTESTKTE